MRAIAVTMLVAASGLAAAEPAATLAERWPVIPVDHALSLEDQITERLTLIGNTLGYHLDVLSNDLLTLRFDGRRRHAHLRLGGGSNDAFAFRLDSDIQFDDINARVDTHIDLGYHGHRLRFDLPTFEMVPAGYRGDYGLELRLPLLTLSF